MLLPYALLTGSFSATGSSSMPLAYCRMRTAYFSPRWDLSTPRLQHASCPMVCSPRFSIFLCAAPPTKNNSRIGRGHILSATSRGNRVWHLSGFSKSEAILARSLLVEIPIFTVNPRSFLIRSRISLATSRGLPKRWMVLVMSRKISSILNFSWSGVYSSKSSIMRREHLM